LTTKILERFKQQLAAVTLIPSSGGKFEIELDGKLIYSKLQTGCFPDKSQMLEQVAARLAG